jgi:hypothetical protein
MSLVAVNDYQQLLANEFRLEFFNGTLSQLKESNPTNYSGPGCITQDKSGKLRLKLYHSYSNDEQLALEGLEFFNNDHPFGKIIADEHYFSFEATDMQGLIWRAEKIWLEGDMSFPAGGRIVEANIHSLETVQPHTEQSKRLSASGYAVVPGTYHLPSLQIDWNALGEKFQKCELKLHGQTCRVQRYEKRLEISFDIPDLVHAKEYSKRLLQAIGFAIGAFFHPVLEGITDKTNRSQVLRSRRNDLEIARIFPPVPRTWPHHVKHIESLVSAFLMKEPKPFPKFLGYWYRTLISTNGDPENQALVLSTSIEGVIKHYFEVHLNADKEYVDQVDAAIPKIRTLEIGARAKDSAIKSLLGSRGRGTKNGLHALAKTGVITETLVERWQHLRNKSAHAEGLQISAAELQKFLDEIHACLELFYRLILSHLDYTDQYVRYSECEKGVSEPPTAELPMRKVL